MQRIPLQPPPPPPPKAAALLPPLKLRGTFEIEGPKVEQLPCKLIKYKCRDDDEDNCYYADFQRGKARTFVHPSFSSSATAGYEQVTLGNKIDFQSRKSRTFVQALLSSTVTAGYKQLELEI